MRHLLKKGAACLSLMCVLLLGSASEGAAQTARVGREFELKAGRVVTLDRGGLRVRFVRVAADSRCPTDVTCVWAGNAEVLFEVSGRGLRRSKTLRLNTNQGSPEAMYGRYTVRLVALSPQPHSKRRIPASRYAATLLVSKE